MRNTQYLKKFFVEFAFVPTSELTLPYCMYRPTQPAKASIVPGIPSLITGQFRNPIFAPRPWKAAGWTAMHMPKATANLNRGHESSQNYIGVARQIPSV